RRALEILGPLARARPHDPDVLREQLDSLFDLAALLDFLKRPADERAEASWQALEAQYNLGRCLARAGRPEEARREFREALAKLDAEPVGSPLRARERFTPLRAELARFAEAGAGSP